MGTLIVILAFFRREIYRALSATRRLDFETEDGKMLPLDIVGVIPTLAIGLIFGRLIEETFQDTTTIAIALIFCGIVLFPTRFAKGRTDSIGYSTAIMIGIAQGIAIIPGISRSGVTISVAFLLGINREKAFKFSFLLSIPAVLGALSLTLYTELAELTSSGLEIGEMLAGLIIAMLVGYLALQLLWKTISKKRFHLFAHYCWIIGILLLLVSNIM